MCTLLDPGKLNKSIRILPCTSAQQIIPCKYNLSLIIQVLIILLISVFFFRQVFLFLRCYIFFSSPVSRPMVHLPPPCYFHPLLFIDPFHTSVRWVGFVLCIFSWQDIDDMGKHRTMFHFLWGQRREMISIDLFPRVCIWFRGSFIDWDLGDCLFLPLHLYSTWQGK